MPRRPDPQPLHVQLRAAREAKGLTAAAVARELGHQGLDSRVASPVLAYESVAKSARTPSPDTLCRLAKLYGRTIEYVAVTSDGWRVVVRAEPEG